ncbi:MAG TPA: hypothetical protein DEF78_09045, partial [Sphingobacterium sp.]|nr:hypothetical protein [Sphingobacterium sp.]
SENDTSKCISGMLKGSLSMKDDFSMSLQNYKYRTLNQTKKKDCWFYNYESAASCHHSFSRKE